MSVPSTGELSGRPFWGRPFSLAATLGVMREMHQRDARTAGSPREWRLGPDRAVALDRPRIMAIVNVSPDSFAEAGKARDTARGLELAAAAVEQGADILDIGGESTRPGAAEVPPEEQERRVLPLVRAVRGAPGLLGRAAISIDTTSARVARACLDAGADVINDQSAGRDDAGMLGLAAERGCGLVLMHRPVKAMRDSYSDRYAAPPRYGDVAREVRGFLLERAGEAVRAGVSAAAIALDPGLGFGKSVEDNLRLIERNGGLAGLGFVVVSALSRKSFTGRAGMGRDSTPEERLHASIGLGVLHLVRGARVFRVHDVRPHREALDAAWAAVREGVGEG